MKWALVIAFSLMADGPRALNDAEKLAHANAALKVTMAEADLHRIRAEAYAAISNAEERYRKASREYEASVEKLKKSAAAGACQLSVEHTWKCEESKKQ